ncbi:Expansin-like A3, partial [Bienertia sinuspersici]
MKMAVFLLSFIFLFISSASAACNQCVLSKAAFFASSKGLSTGACGYGPLALNMYGGHVAAAAPSLYKKGEGCGACYQIRCKNSGICSARGTEIVVSDIHTGNTTDFVLSSRAFRAMALPGKDKQLLQIGIANVEYRRVPCVYKGQNLTIRVAEFSKPPNYLAIQVLYQGVFDTSNAPTGKLMLRFIINSGFDARYFQAGEVLPANWKPGVMYQSKAQIKDVALDGCAPCKP